MCCSQTLTKKGIRSCYSLLIHCSLIPPQITNYPTVRSRIVVLGQSSTITKDPISSGVRVHWASLAGPIGPCLAECSSCWARGIEASPQDARVGWVNRRDPSGFTVLLASSLVRSGPVIPSICYKQRREKDEHAANEGSHRNVLKCLKCGTPRTRF